MKRTSPSKERRKWPRLGLAIPVFVRSREDNGKESLEFATAINVSAGGAMVLVRRSLPKATAVSLEIPSAPIAASNGLRSSSRTLRARTVWVAHLNDYHLLGVKFSRPLQSDIAAIPKRQLRKVGSAL